MSFCCSTVFSMKTGLSFIINQFGDHFPIDLVAYKYLIEKLMYLACRTRPNITIIVRQLNCHNSNNRVANICIAK